MKTKTTAHGTTVVIGSDGLTDAERADEYNMLRSWMQGRKVGSIKTRGGVSVGTRKITVEDYQELKDKAREMLSDKNEDQD